VPPPKHNTPAVKIPKSGRHISPLTGKSYDPIKHGAATVRPGAM